MITGHATQAILELFLPIYVHSLRIDSILDFDLYIYNGRDVVLYRACHLPFTAKTQAALLENNVSRLYVPIDKRRQYQRYIQTHIDKVLADPSVDDFIKSSIVYDSAKELIKDVLSNPTLGENIKSSQAMVESTVLYILEGPNAFHNMLRVMSFDYSVYSHSVNVCTFSLALAHAAGINRTRELVELGTGALLHDVGKTKVSESILNKRGPLDPSEMETVRQHPRWGVELVRETDLIPEVSYLPIKQHHERENHSGYPDGVGSDEIHPYSKILAIADVFDAMTTERVYRSAIGTYPALKTMHAKKDSFDRRFLELFTRLLGPTGCSSL
jgi:putative nucleotidyltransferase with HDIG domain